MSGIGAWILGTSQLDDAVDKATSELLPAGAEDIALNLEICDQIRSKSVPAKDAMRALKRRLNHKNPNVQLLALSLTDVCIKNGGDLFLVEIASREFIDNLVSILEIPALNHEVKGKILRLVQNWSVAFEGKPSLNYVGQVYKNLLSEGYRFPPKDLAVANLAMVDSQTAPDWVDSELCLRCRTPFSFTNRKHHCRNCGQVFDQACSSKTMALPHFGITQEVRVCDGCHSKLTKKAEKAAKVHRHSTFLPVNRYKSAHELADAELQRAIQLSLEEARNNPGYVAAQPSSSSRSYSEPPLIDRSMYPDRQMATVNEEEDPDLKAAIEASLREAAAPKPSAPVIVEAPQSEFTSYPYTSSSLPRQSSLPIDLNAHETDLNQTLEQAQARGGRDLPRYPVVTSLEDATSKEQILSDMNNQLSQAVHLYHQILSQQVDHPRWRTSSMIPASPQVQQQPANFARSGYNQWAGQQPIQSSYQPQRESMSPQIAYGAPPVHEQQPQYGMLSHLELQSYQQPQQSQQPAYQSPAQLQQQQYADSTISVVSPPQLSAPISIPPQSIQYAQPQFQSYSASQIPPAPVSFSRARSTPSSPVLNTSSIAIPVLPQSPPPQSLLFRTASPQIPSLQSSLGRDNSISYSTAAPANPPSHLARSNTVASHPGPQFQQQTPVKQQLVASPPPTPVLSLSQFPSVPTSVPQPTFSNYNSSIPQGFEERKEALLIEL